MNIKDVGLLDKDGDGRLSLDEFMQGATTADTSSDTTSDTTPDTSRDTTAAPQDILLESGKFSYKFVKGKGTDQNWRFLVPNDL